MHRASSLHSSPSFWWRIVRTLSAIGLAGIVTGAARDTWWPAQKLPTTLVRVSTEAVPANLRSEGRMLAQSLAGLAAQAVNAGRHDELVWIETDNPSIRRWGALFLSDHPAIRDRGIVGLWTLVDAYRHADLVQGYILYRRDSSVEVPGQKYRPGMDVSVNIATSLAPILHGVIIGEGLESEAKRHGLKLLADVRAKTQQWCFDTYRDQFRRDMLCTQDPRKPNARDYAIAQGTFTAYGPDPVIAEALKWLTPPSPVLGWNGGDEFHTTQLATVNGQFETCTDWVENLPVLMAGASDTATAQVPRFDPRTIDWNDQRSTVSFTCSDGDNVQWFETSFFDGPGYYWSNPHRGRIPFGWTAPLTHLTQLVPQAMEYAAETSTPNDYFIEWHSGYYYPDLFALDRPNRWELLAEQARRSWAVMQRTGATIIGFNLRYLNRPDARTALETIAAQTDGLLAILAFQYSPYNAGAGAVLWVKDKHGIEIPVITLRYQIWWNLNKRVNTGTPMKIAREIRGNAARADAAGTPRHDWAMVHAWSYFRSARGSNDENAQNLPVRSNLPAGKSYEDLGGVRGYDPALWSAEVLPSAVHVVSVPEMAWRIRMEHDPATTKKLLTSLR